MATADGAGDHRRRANWENAPTDPEAGYQRSGGHPRCAAKAERRGRGWRRFASPAVVDGLVGFGLFPGAVAVTADRVR